MASMVVRRTVHVALAFLLAETGCLTDPKVHAFVTGPIMKAVSGPTRACTGPVSTDDEGPLTRQKVVHEISAVAGAALAGTGALTMSETADALSTSLAPAEANAEADRRQVAETIMRWRDTLTCGAPDAAKRTAALYSKDGVLWGTVSEEVRDTPEEIYDYFDYFARLPGLRLTEYTPAALRVYGDFATEAGTYTFAWRGKGDEKKEKRARFSFTVRRDPQSPTAWTIVEHHSSAMPTSPIELKHVKIVEF